MAKKQLIKITCDVKHTLPVDALTPLQGELKSLTEKKYEKLKASLLRHGFVFPEYVWKNGGKNYITDGHQRIRALSKMAQDGIELEGGQVPVVYVQAKNKKHAMELIIAATSQYGTLDEDSVYEFISSNGLQWEAIRPFADFPSINMGKLTKGWFDSDWTPEEREASEDVPAKPAKPKTKPGDMYTMGDHVLICGDASEIDLPTRYSLLVMDPPYGVSYSEKNVFLNAFDKGNRNQVPIENDHAPPSEMSELWQAVFARVRQQAVPGASYYVTGPQGGDLLILLQLALRECDFPLKHMLIWAKNNHVLGRSDYNYKHEPIMYGWVKGSHRFYGDAEVSLWEIAKPQKSELHPTMKPVELYARAIRNSSASGDWVADPFAGSGPIAIAAEKHGRRAEMIEIDPAYCDVIVERWQDFTGKKAKRNRG